MTSTSNGQSTIIRTERGLVIAGARVTRYDLMDYIHAGYPHSLLRNKFYITDKQFSTAISYINMSENLLSSSDAITKINKILHRIESEIQTEQGLRDFDTIELPFKLVEAGIDFWTAIYSPEVLRQLANADPDTLDAWAIALSQTLNRQFIVLNNWLPHLSTLPITPTLKQKISDLIAEINQISSEKSQLLQSATELFNQEQKLHSDTEELSQLRQKDAELKTIQAELQSVDLDSFRQEITNQSATLEPKATELKQLQQQKAEIDSQIMALQQQQAVLEGEIEYQKLKQRRQQTGLLKSTKELITLTQAGRTKLDESLSTALTDLEEQRREYQQLWEQLQAGIQAFNRYQVETDEIRTHLYAYYQANQTISQQLPIDYQKVNAIIQTIEHNLAQLDQEIANARRQHEQSQQKTILTF
ncbi:hypothetical protein G7B40_000240 [Aetokthonos hydrillicola Thurmond2011]|uniref:Uncharacterized protein n=1 Tax=Aetokthonos hydrillicola Thurmond2011 TaxID=2712845 RepID=A0AAP5M880_9CYAN|nr:hypothetical protein [Aetokthonos hydrillicola]MDR9893014.1 hypothetical protein [Aetokthonos hydrillicola Thurmond2011]